MRVQESYVARLNQAMETTGLSVDALARSCGYPADLLRPLLAGSPVTLSEAMNRKLCEVLGLDPAEMWQLADRRAASSNSG